MDLRRCASTSVLSLALALAGCTNADVDAEPDASGPDPACFPTVTFADPLLEAQLIEERPGEWRPVFDGTILRVCDSRHGCGTFYGIRDFDGLQCLPEIQAVECVACPIDDLRPLRHVRNLVLSGANIRDLDDLRDFDDFYQLMIQNSSIENVDALFSGDAVFSSLDRISLTGNRIAAIAGTPDLPKLRQLDLSDNELTELPPPIPSVEHLLLAGNELSEVPSAADWPALKRLVLSDNRVVDITPLAEHTELSWIELAGNGLADVSALSGHPLHLLDLSRNLLESVGELSLPQAETLILDDNPLVDVSGLVAPMLQNLAASDGALVNVPPASALPSDELHLAGNQISDLAPLAPFALPGGIRTLDLSRNPIDLTTLPPGLVASTLILDAAGLTSLAGIETAGLHYLSLADNDLSDLSPLAAMDTSLTNLRWVELAGNPITTLAPLDGTSWGHLGLARTGYNALEELLGPASGVRELDLRSNGITDASALASGPLQVRDLNLSDNLLTSMPALLPADDRLDRLDLSDNPLAELGPLPPTVHDFACRHCALSSLDGLTSPQSQISTLDLTGNPIESIAAIAELHKLDRLILDEVSDLDLTPLAFRENVLSELSIQRSGLQDAAQLLTLARHVDLRDNELRDLPPEDPSSEPRQSVDLSGNPINASPEALVAQCSTRDLTLSPFYCYSWDPGS